MWHNVLTMPSPMQVDFNVEEARSELRRLGLLDCTGPSSTLKVLDSQFHSPLLACDHGRAAG